MTLEERIARLEARIPELTRSAEVGEKTFFALLVLSVAALYTAFRGLGFPNHPYQGVLGILATALAYHRGWFLTPARPHHWALAPINALILSMLLKLVIGGGARHPLHWLQYPSIMSQKAEGKWIPEFNMIWAPTTLSAWEIDFTVIQTFLLIVSLAGALFDLDLFVSLILFVLILISIPIFASFEWSWVFPALLTSAVAFYLNSSICFTRSRS